MAIPMSTFTTRREFSRAAIGAVSATALSQSRILGANDRIRLGIVGCGGRGTQDWDTFLQQPDVEPVAACDVYEPFLNRAISTSKGRAKGYHDFRRLLEQKDIDAVIVATPDHWHTLMTVAACDAGKDVYCEKPLTLMLGEGRHMVTAARRNNRVVQAGSQQRSAPHYIQAVKLIHDGGIGEVHRIHAGYQRNALPGFTAKEITTSTPPATLDWDMWLGPAPKIAFDPFRCIYNFRWFWDYSGGQMTNWGAHHLDISRWILAEDAPISVAGAGGRYALKDGGETPDVQQVTYQFSKGVVTWTTSEIATGNGFTLDIYGSKGMMSLTRSGFTVKPEVISPDGKTPQPPAMEALSVKGTTPNDPHARNFLDCIKSRAKPNADVEEGNRSAVMCHLGNISTRLGRSLKWDAAKEQIVGDSDANQWLMKPYRGSWKLA
jgi:predicted dehydrogenase